MDEDQCMVVIVDPDSLALYNEDPTAAVIENASAEGNNLVYKDDPTVVEYVKAVPSKKQKLVLQNKERQRKAVMLCCEYCDGRFAKQFDLEQHLRSHTGERPFQCLICGRAFAQRSNVKKHMTTHKVWPKAVNKLPSEYLKEPELLKLEEAETLMKNQLECDYCESKFNSYAGFRSHLPLHNDEKRFKCFHEGCQMLFEEAADFVTHLGSEGHRSDYSCQLGCGKTFSNLNALTLHLEAHRILPKAKSKEKKTYSCPSCPATFSTAKGLDYHSNTAKDHSFECGICGKRLSNQRYLKQHLVNQHISSEEGKFRCDVCQNSFRSASYLEQHKLIHTGELPFQCEFCDLKFNRQDKLKRHQLLHTGQRLACPYSGQTGCKKDFYRADKLRDHLAVHEGLPPVKCELCDEVFKKPAELAFHDRIVHPKSKPLKCFKCNMRFKQEKQRQLHHKKVHNLVHTVAVKDEEDEDA